MQNILILFLSLFLLSACNGGQATSSLDVFSSPSPQVTLSPTPRPSFTNSPFPTFETIILPTPTPILYEVEQNDTLIGIARKFGITLEELLAANPSVGSQALTVDSVLVIPPKLEVESEPTATPWPVSILQTQCFQNRDDSLWCLVLLRNENAETLQNISIEIRLLDSKGDVDSVQTAFSPLDLLPSGKTIALGALFMAPIPDNYKAHTNILSASSLPSSDIRYQLTHLQNYIVQVDWSEMNARVSGQVVLDKQSESVNRIWILAVAYDNSKNVIGFQRWESNASLIPEDVLSFDFGISSLGPPIDHIDLFVEAAK